MPIRVVHVLPHRGGGGETYVDMLGRLPDLGHERVYLSAGRSPVTGAATIPLGLARLARTARGADLLHVHGDVATCLALPWLGRTPSIMTTHGLHMLRRAGGASASLVQLGLRRASRRLRAIICTSAAELDELQDVLPADVAHKLTVVHNGIDLPAAQDGGGRERIRTELEVGPEELLGLFAGQLEPRKAPVLAAWAAERVRAAGVPFRLLVAGEGPQRTELERAASPATAVLGFRSDLDALMSAADIFVQPSHREGMSLALLEAMAHGLPVVAADGGGNAEAVGAVGLLFPAGDEGALAEALTELCRRPQLRDELGAAARVRVTDHFAAGRFLDDTAAVYAGALHAAPRS